LLERLNAEEAKARRGKLKDRASLDYAAQVHWQRQFMYKILIRRTQILMPTLHAAS
jgi:hypothetical protein